MYNAKTNISITDIHEFAEFVEIALESLDNPAVPNYIKEQIQIAYENLDIRDVFEDV